MDDAWQIHPRGRPAGSTREVHDRLPRPRPERVALHGRRVVVEALDAARHGDALHALGHDGTPEAQASWAFLPYGPFASADEHRSWLVARQRSDDPLFFAIVGREDGRAAGVASLLSIVPEHGTIELGHIWLSPRLQRTAAATEALVLLLGHAIDDLGYRRMEWKCNAANAASRRAAVRLGFRFEGVFFDHLVVKGRNRDTAWYSIVRDEWPPLRAAFAEWLAPENFTEDGAQRRSLTELTRRAHGERRA
jgi:RimJ/RimL family protein N-acetyltransferase